MSRIEKCGYFYSEQQAVEAAQRLNRIGFCVISVEEFEEDGSEATHIVRYEEDEAHEHN